MFIVFRCVVLINISDLETKTGNNNIVHVDEDGNEVMEHVTVEHVSVILVGVGQHACVVQMWNHVHLQMGGFVLEEDSVYVANVQYVQQSIQEIFVKI